YNLILDVFSPQEAERFIRKRITMPAAMPLATYDAHVKALAQKLEYHPLAIALACGYMNNKINRMRGITLEKYLQDFDRIWKESSAPQQLAVSLQISLDILTPAQREFFFQCCYLCPTDIASTIFVDHVHANDEQILDFMTLSDLSLTNFNDESRRDYFSIHRLTQHIGRMIFEASCSGADAAQTQQNLKRFFVGLHQRLSNRVHAIKDAFNLTNDPESLKKLYDDLTHMISHWEKLCAHALDHKIKLLDPEAKAIQLIRTKVSRKLLALEAEQEQSFDYVLRRQMPIPAEDMDVLHTIYNKLFAHIPKSQEALTLYPALFKLYQAGNMGFSIAEDHPHFFANQSAADCLSILLFLMGIKRLPHPLQGERLAMASDMIKEGTSPMMALASVYDADLNPMEAHTFIARLDGDHVPLSYHVMVQNLLLYKKLPPHAQQFVSTLHHIHEIGLTQLVQMTQVRKAGSFILNEYARYLTESLGAFRDFSEFNMAIENIPYFTLYLAQFPKTQAMRSADCARIKQILDTTPITQQRILALMTLAKNVDILDEAMPYINPSMNGYDVKDLFEAARKHQALDPESRQSIMDLAEQALSISTLRERGFLKPHHVLSVYQKIQHLRTNEQFDDIMTVVRAFMKDELDAGTLQSEEILVYLDAVPLAFESSVHYVSAIEQSFKWPPYLTPYDKGVLFGWIAHQYFRCLSSASEQNLANQPHQTYTEKEQRLNALAQQYADVSQNPWKTLKHIVHDVQAKQPSGFDLAGIFEGAVAHTQNIEPLMDKANALGIFADDVDNIPMGLYALDCLTEDRLDFLLENHVYLRLFDGVSINRFVLMAASMTHEQWLHLTNNLPNMDAYQSYFLTNRFQMSLPDFMKQLPKSTQLA
ncbi:MAG: hypothetical protein Q8K36_04545, partial [Alphaproteobacteria bacterium]|nr:hypothetical protein [Alphaproteobacteria bacterium]